MLSFFPFLDRLTPAYAFQMLLGESSLPGAAGYLTPGNSYCTGRLNNPGLRVK